MQRVAAAVDPERRRGALVRLSCETDFVAFTGDFRSLCRALARTSARLGSADIEQVCGATRSTTGDANALEALSRRCGEELRVDRLELFDAADACGVATREDCEGAVLVQSSGGAAALDADACDRLAAHALSLESAVRARFPLARDAELCERSALDVDALDRLAREHGAIRARLVVRWGG